MGQNRSGKVSAWGPVALWAATLFGLSSLPGSSFPQVGFTFADKIVHIAVYGVLGALICRALKLTTRAGPAELILMSVLGGAAYGVSDEVHQLFVPLRSFDGLDMVADAVGATLGALAALRLVRQPQNPERERA